MTAIRPRRVVVPLGALLLAIAPATARAQAAAPIVAAADSGDSVPHQKHGGLFGKAKRLAGSKVVKSVAKVAACTMVPAGQAIAGAIDAGDAKNAGEAAQGAAAATGTSCMPGVGGAGMAGAGMGGAGLANASIGSAAASAAASAGAASVRSDGTQAMMPYGATSGMPGVEQAMAGAQIRMAQAQAQTVAGTMTEAPGQLPALAADPAAELAKGKTAVRQVDWIAGSSEVSASASLAFQKALGELGQAMRQAGGRYRIDLYLMQRYDDAAARMYGPGRLAAIQQLLGTDGLSVEPGKIKRDQDARIEIVRLK